MIIGLYDVDMWHQGKSVPNLELMKIYNYFYQKNNRVIMMKPNQNESIFSQIYYFKENHSCRIPKSLTLNQEKKQLIGCGFYGKIPTLKPEIHKMPPNYEPYDIYANKLKVAKGYDKLKRNSLVRIETNDFSDFKTNAPYIYIADSNFLYSNGAEDFVNMNKNNHTFIFYNPLSAKDEITFNRFLRYSSLFNRRIVIDFQFDDNFFYENFKERVYFNFERKSGEDKEEYLIKLTKIILYYKNNNVSFYQLKKNNEDYLESKIIEWGISKRNISFYDYCLENNYSINQINSIDSELRLLLKQNPQKIKNLSIDF